MKDGVDQTWLLSPYNGGNNNCLTPHAGAQDPPWWGFQEKADEVPGTRRKRGPHGSEERRACCLETVESKAERGETWKLDKVIVKIQSKSKS